jgi:hypothetical protein
MAGIFTSPPPIEHVIEDLHGVHMLLAGLHAHPGGEAGQVLVFEVGRHREVCEGRVELVPDLLVQGILHPGTDHRTGSSTRVRAGRDGRTGLTEYRFPSRPPVAGPRPSKIRSRT